MDIGSILGLIKIALEVYQDERKDRYLKKYLKLEREWMHEMGLPDYERSDLRLDTIMFECGQLAKLIVEDRSDK